MATPKETTWEITPHTLVKHEILRRYLLAWFAILGTTQNRVIYLDGFSGPGEYKGGEPGSPLIALEAAKPYHEKLKGSVSFYFLDDDCKRIEHLKTKLEAYQEYSKFDIETACEEFECIVTKTLDDLDEEGGQMAPTFAFIDPFGFKGLPMDLVHRLLSFNKTEALINFNLNAVNRFVEHPDPEIRAQIIGLFGTEEVLEAIKSKDDRYSVLRMLYQQQLRKAATYVRFFSIRDVKGNPIYDLFFAGNHSEGHYRMKEAMWKVDPTGGNSFSDSTDPYQAVLFGEDSDVAFELLPKMLKRYGSRDKVVVKEILDWIRNETGYLEKHMRAALKLGEADGRFKVESFNVDGSKRRNGDFTPKAVIDFTWLPQPAWTQGTLF